MSRLIEQLCEQRGIASGFTDAWGNPAQVVEESKGKLLKAMGYAIDDEETLKQQIAEEEVALWEGVLPATTVIRDDQALQFEIRLPVTDAGKSLNWVIEQEDGKQQKGKLVAADGELTAVHTLFELEYHAYQVTLPISTPWGYHNFKLLDGKAELGQMFLIIAPQRCFKQSGIEQGRKTWGPSVQLYSLRSRNNWGVGDFSDLTQLIEETAKLGGDFVGLNPIHSLYPSNPESASPYDPSSRRWLNVLYIDVTAVPEFAQSNSAQDRVNSTEFRARLDELRAREYVDYTGVTQAKVEVLKLVFAEFAERHLGRRTKRGKAYTAFVKEGGDSLQQQATFEALQADLYGKGMIAWGWPAFPEELNEYHKPAVAEFAAEHQQDVNFYIYLQFLADEQMAAADAKAHEMGMEMGLYRDLAVGVNSGSTELWADRDLYCAGATVGAPPDILGPLGQNWGLPPMNPVKLFERGYQPMVDLFRSNMRSCGSLRIDHAMALLRLWWIPKGETADQGAYVYYPIDDILGVLALESHRNQCLIIGEDLGTVPDGIFETFQQNGIHSYRLFFFETSKEDKGFISPAHYPQQAMAALTTHDMPTLRGFWHCDDLALGRELGLYPDSEVLQGLYNDRHENKQRLLDSLHGHHALPDWYGRDASWIGMDRELNYDMQLHMAKGSCSLLSIQLEDWLEMDKPVNVPGTYMEYPNWRRKLSADLEDIFATGHICDQGRALTQARSPQAAY